LEARGKKLRTPGCSPGSIMAGITGIGGEKFSVNPGDWPETKTEIIG